MLSTVLETIQELGLEISLPNLQGTGDLYNSQRTLMASDNLVEAAQIGREAIETQHTKEFSAIGDSFRNGLEQIRQREIQAARLRGEQEKKAQAERLKAEQKAKQKAAQAEAARIKTEQEKALLAAQKTSKQAVSTKAASDYVNNFIENVLNGRSIFDNDNQENIKLFEKYKEALIKFDGHQKNTVIHYLAKSTFTPDNKRSLEILLDSGADINAKNEAGRTPLLEAIYLGTFEQAELLLEKGADCEAKDNNNKTVLQVIDSKITERFISSDKKAAYQKLRASVAKKLEQELLDLVDEKLEKEPSLSGSEESQAISFEDLGSSDSELDQDCTLSDPSPTIDSSGQESIDMDVDLLKSYIKSNAVSGLEKLLTERPNLLNYEDAEHNSLLHFACKHGSLNMINMLLNKGLAAQIDKTNSSGYTALYIATLDRSNLDPDIVAALLKAGADTSIKYINSHGTANIGILIARKGKLSSQLQTIQGMITSAQAARKPKTPRR